MSTRTKAGAGARQHLLALASGALMLLLCFNATADARTEYLISMLEKGGNYRVRVQAATTLGKIRSHDALPALLRALKDENELVVISSATAIAQIGDTSAISGVEAAVGSAPSPAAESQLAATLRVLKALTPDGEPVDTAGVSAQFLIRVDAMGNSSGVQRADVTELMRTMVLKALRKVPEVQVQEPGLKNDQIKQKLKKEKLKGYILSGSIIRMEQVSNQMVVKISLNVFSNPDYNLLMMPSAEGSIPVMSGTLARETERAAQEQALKAVTEALLRNVIKTLQQSE